MTVTEGLDPSAVREIAVQLDGSARGATLVLDTGNVRARELAPIWQGADAEELLDRWYRLAPALDSAAEALRGAAAGLRAEVDAQEAASDGGSGTSRVGAGGAPVPMPDAPAREAGSGSPPPWTNPAPRAAMAFAPTAGHAALALDAAAEWTDAKPEATNPPWDVNPETGTAMVGGRNVPNWEFADRTYGGPGWSKETAEETGSEWSTELQEKYPDGVEFTPEGFPLFYPYVHPDHEPVVIELTNSSSKDIRLAYEAAGIDKDTAKELQKDWVWHHTHVYDQDTDEGELILVPRDLHAAVKHAGGRSLHKNTGGETSD